MTVLRIVVAMDAAPLPDLLRHQIEGEDDMRIVGEAHSPAELLITVSRCRADAVVLSMPNDGSMPGICTHLFAEFPAILIVGWSEASSRAWVYRQSISRQAIEGCSVADLPAVLRGAEGNFWTAC